MDKSCPACQGQFKQFAVFPKHLIYKCSNCGLGCTTNIGKQVGDYHRDEVYIKEEARFSNIFLRRVKLVNTLTKSKGKILDIGSSTGLMLSLFKQEGWEVRGVEMSQKAAQFATKRGIETEITAFEQARLANRSLDAVIINHTLEHLEHPQSVLHKISDVLKTDGVLLIDVPNFGSLSAQLRRGNWPYLLPDEHLWHFTAEALTLMLKKEGLIVVSRTSPSGIWDYSSPGSELLSALFGLKKRFFSQMLTFIPDYFISFLNMGTSLTIVAKKND